MLSRHAKDMPWSKRTSCIKRPGGQDENMHWLASASILQHVLDLLQPSAVAAVLTVCLQRATAAVDCASNHSRKQCSLTSSCPWDNPCSRWIHQESSDQQGRLQGRQGHSGRQAARKADTTTSAKGPKMELHIEQCHSSLQWDLRNPGAPS